MTTPDEFAAKMTQAARAIEGASRDGVNHAAEIVGHAVDTSVATVLGTDRAFSGIPKAKVGALVKKARAVKNPQAVVQATPAGLAKIVESGAKPHVVGAQSARGKALKGGTGLADGRVLRTLRSGREVRSKVGGGALMANAGRGFGPVRGPFVAGGFRGTHAVSRAFDVMAPRVSDLVHRETSKAIGKAFR